MTDEASVEALLRSLTPQVLGTLVRRHHQFDLCEDAVQEALLTASVEWPHRGLPANPRGWLVTVANRRMIDIVRSEQARRRREEGVAAQGTAPSEPLDLGDDDAPPDADDTLRLLLLCCHPSLTPPSQIALTLRAVGGLTTAEIAASFFVPEATMGQRISRAKAKIQAAGATFQIPTGPELDERMAAVMHVLYLIFNEGHTAVSGSDISRPDLTGEAIRLTRELVKLRPGDAEAEGLLALMLLTDARRAARTTESGDLVLLADQDRRRWDRALIDEGVALVSTALARHELGPYQLQAAIAAVHDEAPSDDETDWAQILVLHELLEQVAPNPMASLSRAVAVAKVHGGSAGLDVLDSVAQDERVRDHYRLQAVRAYLLSLEGDQEGARLAYLAAARLTSSGPERRHLLLEAGRCRTT